MYKEFEKFSGEPRSALLFLSEVSFDAASRISARIFIDEQNLAIKSLPVGGEKGLEPILSFMPLAKEGFNLNLRSEQVVKSQILDILAETSIPSISELTESLGYAFRPRVVKEEPSLALFRHTMTTILVLSKIGTVDAKDLNTETLVSTHGVSHWPHKPSIEDLWVLLKEIESATRKMILEKTPGVRKEEALRAAHFFAEGSSLARKMF